MINLYIGYDSKEDEASKVCAFSAQKNCSEKLSINFLKIKELRKKKIYIIGVMTSLEVLNLLLQDF